ncbi:Uncharacterised protein [uncultured Clostridium sp.]|nr:Uncharacterised protein [uncultured Clostridium sp.]SCJ35999.1 Uncharacterised protein [uncultured Clostridium sp.]
MSKKIAYTGILLALNIILLLLSNIIPINTVFFMGLASFLISIVIMEYGFKLGILFYIASSVLSFLVLSNKAQWLIYIFTFGIYGLIKYLVEKDRPFYIDILIKLVYANLIILSLYFMLKGIIYIPINIFTILVFQFAFLIYDYVYTLFIDYYEQRIRKIIKPR